MSISKYYVPISNANDLMQQLLKEEFAIDSEIAKEIAEGVQSHFDNLIDTCFLVVETEYIDKVYRDSYYEYYSSKLVPYKRNCVRISIFQSEVREEDFTNSDSLDKIRALYSGFIVLRPTEPNVIGRSLISPKVLRDNNFLACSTKVEATVNAVKVCCDGFPHSSQDRETITCAETTIWALMEYFGSKYPEYKPVLPSVIIQELNKISVQRQVPSTGLNVQQMSFAIKKFGFEPRIYTRAQYSDNFDGLLSIYIESGIPIVVALDGARVKHALLCIGREKVAAASIDQMREVQIGQHNIASWDSIRSKFIFIDDNFPVYQKAFLDDPVRHYIDCEAVDWTDCKINHFIVPLYSKIHLEAFQAKKYILQFLGSDFSPIENNENLVLRVYLASSRSFKHHIAMNAKFDDSRVRDAILEISMPKFVWVAELSTKEDIKRQTGKGLVLLDATEANLEYNYPLLLAYHGDKMILPNLVSNTLIKKDVPLTSFTIFEGNLKNAQS